MEEIIKIIIDLPRLLWVSWTINSIFFLFFLLFVLGLMLRYMIKGGYNVRKEKR